MENNNNKAAAQGAETKERTFTMTFPQIKELSENKQWMDDFIALARKMDILTTKQLLKATKPKK